VRALPRRRRQGLPARVAAAGRQPVDHDGLAGQLDPHGAQRRLPAGDAEESEAARHAALLAVITYIRVAWNNSGTPVQPNQANELRKLLPE